LIICGFEKDFCHWEHLPVYNGSKYAWHRDTSISIEGQGLPGPPSDILGLRNTTFAFVSNMLPPDGPPGSITDLFSPYLIGEQHKVECFAFWLYFAVSFGLTSNYSLLTYFETA
jgi:hypothetical protein